MDTGKALPALHLAFSAVVFFHVPGDLARACIDRAEAVFSLRRYKDGARQEETAKDFNVDRKI